LLGGNIPIDWFDRYLNKELLCRRKGCKRKPKYPLQKYCSERCKRSFLKFYFQYIEWASLREDIIARDNWQCVLCKKKGVYPHENLEVDHIVPRVVIYDKLLEEFQKLKPKEQSKTVNRRKFYIDYLIKINDRKNLRTLCKECHSIVTGRFNATYKKRVRRDLDGIYPISKAQQVMMRYKSMTDLSNMAYNLFPFHGRYYSHKSEELTPEQKRDNDLHNYFLDERNLPYFGFSVFIDMVENFKEPVSEPPIEKTKALVQALTDYF
jgi:5-methylcytosine-specific restriction endonuclease McrA